MYRSARVAIALLALASCSSEPTAPTIHSFAGRIVFVRAQPQLNLNIYVVNPDGTGLINVTHHPAFYDRPAPSPDGSELILYRSPQPADSGDLFAFHAANGRLQQITFSPAFEESVAWKHDGTRLAFVQNRDIYTMAPDGTDLTRLTFDAIDQKKGVVWSPSGAFLAYSRYVGGNASYDLHRITADGQQDTALVTLDGDDMSPAWTRDGSSIIFEHHTSQFSHLYRVDLATGGLTLVTNGSVYDQTPTFSPSGDTLAFSRATIDSSGRISFQSLYLLPAGALDPTLLISFGNSGALAPAWTGQH